MRSEISSSSNGLVLTWTPATCSRSRARFFSSQTSAVHRMIGTSLRCRCDRAKNDELPAGHLLRLVLEAKVDHQQLRLGVNDLLDRGFGSREAWPSRGPAWRGRPA